MECEQEVHTSRISRPVVPVSGVIVCLMVAGSGCTGGSSAPVHEPTADSSTPQPSVPVPDAATGAGTAGWTQYPVDTDADDPPGMIVAGLGENAGAQLVSPWLVSVRTFRRVAETSDFPAGDATIELARYAEDFPVAEHVRFFSKSLDTCLIRDEQGADPSNLPPPGISGGESVTFNTPSGPWLSVRQHRLADAQRVYRAKDLLPGALPVDTTLSIPGDAFPTVGAYPVFEAEPVVRLLPDASQPVTTESRFSWLPLDRPGHVKIDFMAYDHNDDFQGFPITCWVSDDGSFELPGDVLEAMEPFESQADNSLRMAVRYSRVYSRVDLIDGIVFTQETEVAE